MPFSRRQFLHRAVFAAPLAGLRWSAFPSDAPTIVKPPRLRPGDTVGIVSPSGAVSDPDALQIAVETMEALGLKAKPGAHTLDRRGYLAGDDAARASDLNAMFADLEVDAILALRGGWGAARILPLLDYGIARRQPKLIFGYSDVTALLLAYYAKSGLVTVHGPTGVSTWNTFSVDYFRRLLFDGEALTMQNPNDPGRNLVRTEDRVHTITSGMARGRLAGGNLTVLSALVGSGYLPDWTGHILFLEDTGEDLYRIDRMLTQLRLAGILDGLTGFVFGKCTDCDPGRGYGSLTFDEILDDHIAPLGIPAWHGAMIGHISEKWSVPVGVEAEIDAVKGTIRLLEAAVV